MGLGLYDVQMLIRLREAGHVPDHAAVIEIGAQQIANRVLREMPEVERLGRLFGVRSPPPLPQPLPAEVGPDGNEFLSAAAPLARDLWRWLGCSYAVIDIDGSPDAIPLDLNVAGVPPELAGKHHLVTNFGTTEHVANQLNAFKIVHDLTAPGGVMLHTLPSQGAFDHGLVGYSPKFFWALARANDYGWLHFDLVVGSRPHPLPANLVEAIKPFRPEIVEVAATYAARACTFSVALQKRRDAPYAPPTDA
jgi:hypothetical protein